MNPPPAMPDPVKLSRMIRLLNDYLREGLIAQPPRPFTTMTEAELDDLIEQGRARREEQNNPAPEPEPEAPEEPQAGAHGTGQPEPQPEGATTTMPEEGQMTEQEFKDKFPVGTHIEYHGVEHVVVEHTKTGAEGGPHFTTVSIGEEGTTFSKQEAEDGDFEVHGSPRKIPQKVEYPPQVFLVAWQDDSGSNAAIYKDLGAVKNMHPEIDGDAIMEAISDPGTPQVDGDLTITFASIA